MDTILEAAGAVTVVELMGDSLDATTADDVRGHLGYVATENPNLVVDLRRVTFLDSAGCGALVAAQRRCREAGGNLHVCNATGHVKTVLDLARVSRVLGVHPTREQAVAAFG